MELMLVNDLLEQLYEQNPRQVRIVECRIFGGRTLVEIAKEIEDSLATVKKDLRFAKAWLASRMGSPSKGDGERFYSDRK